MKHKLKIFIFLLTCTFSSGEEGDYFLPRINNSGKFEYKEIAPSLSSLIGWTNNLDVLHSISLSTGFSLSSEGVLSLSGITDSMLAGSITPSKITGTAAVLTGAAFIGASSVSTSAASTSSPGFSTQQSWSGSTANLTALSNNVTDARSGAAIGGYLETWGINGSPIVGIARGDQYGNGRGAFSSFGSPIAFVTNDYGMPVMVMAGGLYGKWGIGIQYANATNGYISFSVAQNFGPVYGDLHLGMGGVGTLQLGKPLASSWVSQQITPAGAIVGTTTNGSPSNDLVITNAVSTGTGISTGAIKISTYGSNGSSGTAIGVLTERLRIDANLITANNPIVIKQYTVATLPSATQGAVAYVTDALTPTYLSPVTGGGSVVCPVFFNGTVWVAH